MHGLALAWSYHPHSWEVSCNNKKTPMGIYKDDELFLKCISKRLKMGTYMSNSGIRKMLRIMTGVQSVSNFRPTAAAVIYQKFAFGGVVWDMSGGWGGRMLGAIISDVKKYIVTEPSLKSYIGLLEMAVDFGVGTEIKIHNCGSEEFIPEQESLDLCFTSPPYFDLEKYSNEETQSYKKFSKIDEWKEGFLRKTMENCFVGLKSFKYMVINIADGKSKYGLEKDVIRLAKEIGFEYKGFMRLALSSLKLRKNVEKYNYKFEPLFLFLKPGKRKPFITRNPVLI